jgi:hypothetical protein
MKWMFVLLPVVVGGLVGCQSTLAQTPAPPAGVATAPAPGKIILASGTAPPADGHRLAWVADEVTMDQAAVDHRHAASFVYAPITPVRVKLGGETHTLAPGQAMFIPANVAHTFVPTCAPPTDCRDSFWEIRLTDPAARPVPAAGPSRRVFVSEPLTNLPGGALHVTLAEVPLPAGGYTLLPAAQGPEYLYVNHGDVAYGSVRGPEARLRPGTGQLVPPQRAVAARNEGRAPADLLALDVTATR